MACATTIAYSRRRPNAALHSKGAIVATPTQIIRVHSSRIRPAPRLGSRYEPRPLRFIRRQDLGDWRLKVYGIATPGRAPRTELVEATLAAAVKALPPISDDVPGIGFAIAHDSATSCFALIYWWQSANELHQRIYASPLDKPRALKLLANPAAGCVWELGIIDFERRAWIEDVLKGGDVERYLGRTVNADV
jgi:hypothetical protein